MEDHRDRRERSREYNRLNTQDTRNAYQDTHSAAVFTQYEYVAHSPPKAANRPLGYSNQDALHAEDRKRKRDDSPSDRNVHNEPQTKQSAFSRSTRRQDSDASVREEDLKADAQRTGRFSEKFRGATFEPSEDLHNAMGFVVMREMLANFTEKLPLGEMHGIHWQDTSEGIREGDVLRIPHFEYLKNLKLVVDANSCWYSIAGGFVLVKFRLAVVKLVCEDRLRLNVLTTFGDTPRPTKRERKTLDGTRYVLEGFLHIVSTDSNETFEPEPNCFRGGICLNWRSINNEPPPKKKSSFLPITDHYMLLEGTPRCVVGELAEKVDFETYGIARDSTRDRIVRRHRRVMDLREHDIRDELPTNQKRSSSAPKNHLFQLDETETAEANSATPAEIEDRVQIDYLSSNGKISEERIRQEVAHELEQRSKNKSTMRQPPP
jgi:hypothetical protein